ncbi:MAG: DegT/DnrJ/EryC1/StrS family aminotransferase [Candidatus Omnitrophica bacterium]|nr:DegT/DnrJ/EryC1/StrS family aminotransferase [Candidatus Omnitrophota bacterium]
MKTKDCFAQEVFVTRPNLPSIGELSPLIRKALKRRQVTNFGELHNQLEEGLREALGVKHVVLCCNGTMGLFLLLRALGLKGRVITTAFTFPATVHAVVMAGLEPLFCDIDPDDYTLDADEAEKKLRKDVSCILGVNVFGNPCDIEALGALGKKHGIPVIYDSAHAFFCRYKDKIIGGFGDAEVFSFHATKLFSTIEGGAVTTNNREIYLRLKELINFGIHSEDSVPGIGLNGKLSEIHAAFGLLSLDRIGPVLKKLQALSGCYRQMLSCVPGLKFQKSRPGSKVNNQYMTVEVLPEEFGLTRDQLHAALKKQNVITRKYFYPPAHRYECYSSSGFARSAELPDTDKVAERILCLPIYATLDMKDVKKICGLIRSIQKNAR